MKITQLPWLASALCMTAGLYLLAGPFQSDRSDLRHLLTLWTVLSLYEFSVIGMIAVLRQRGADTFALTLVALFFLADPVFMGDAFTSVSGGSNPLLTTAAALVALVKAWSLARACGYLLTPWRAGWVAAALIGVHQLPNLNAVAAAQPASVIPQIVTWVVAGLAVPLWRDGRLGRAALGAVAVHFVATGIVSSLEFPMEFLTGPLLALSALLFRAARAPPRSSVPDGVPCRAGGGPGGPGCPGPASAGCPCRWRCIRRRCGRGCSRSARRRRGSARSWSRWPSCSSASASGA